jgi:hypothetical protein
MGFTMIGGPIWVLRVMFGYDGRLFGPIYFCKMGGFGGAGFLDSMFSQPKWNSSNIFGLNWLVITCIIAVDFDQLW